MFALYIWVEAYPAGTVTVSADSMAELSGASFTELIGYRNNAISLPFVLVAVKTLNAAIYRSIFISKTLKKR